MHTYTHTQTHTRSLARSLGSAHGAQLEHGALQLQIFGLQVAHLRRRHVACCLLHVFCCMLHVVCCMLHACCLLTVSRVCCNRRPSASGARGHPMRGMTSVVVLCHSRFLLILIVICYMRSFWDSSDFARLLCPAGSSSCASAPVAPTLQCSALRTSQPADCCNENVRARMRASVSARAHVTGVNELIQRLFLYVLHLLLHPGLHAQHSRSHDNDAAESHKQTHYAGRRQDIKHTPSSKRASSRPQRVSGQCHCDTPAA
jgi:hypothetical protein